jgi:hypothetical protein
VVIESQTAAVSFGSVVLLLFLVQSPISLVMLMTMWLIKCRKGALSPRGFFKLTNNLDIVTKILNRSRTFQWESRGLVVIMTPNQTTKPNQNKTTHIGETPRKFKTRVLDSRVEHLPYLHNQQLKPDQLTIIHPEQLVIDHSNTCSSIPITLRKGTRPSIPRGLLSGCRYLNNRQFNQNQCHISFNYRKL